MARAGFSTTDYLSRSGAVVAGPPFSIAAWVRTPTIGVSQQVLGLVDSTQAGNIYHRLWVAAANQVSASTRESSALGGANAMTSTTVTADAWHHVAGVWSAANSRAAYLDGGGKGTDGNTRTPATIDETRIGLSLIGGPWLGRVAEVCFWNVALTDAEVLALAQGRMRPWMVRPGAIVAYLPLWGVASPEPDLSGQGNFSLVGAPTQADHAPVVPLFWMPQQTLPAAVGAGGEFETLSPDFILASTNLTGAVTDIDDDPDSPDGLKMAAVDITTATSALIRFPGPNQTGGPGGTLTGAQNFKTFLPKTPGSANPTVDVDLYEHDGVGDLSLEASWDFVATLSNDLSITNDAGQLNTHSFDASQLTDPDRAVAIKITTTVGVG